MTELAEEKYRQIDPDGGELNLGYIDTEMKETANHSSKNGKNPLEA